MKKYVLLASILLAGNQVQATDTEVNIDSLMAPDQIEELLHGEVQEEMQMFDITGITPSRPGGPGRRPPGDHDRRRPPRDDDRRRPPRDDDGHRRPRPRWVTCYAQDLRRNLYHATGVFPRQVQREAMNTCFQYARRCRALGCR